MGHYARECWSKSVEGNAATSVEPESRSKKEWDFQASYAVEESSLKCELDVEEQSFDMMVVSTCNTEPIEIAFATTNDKMINYKDDWIIDSSCSNHMTGDKEKLVSMSEYKRGRAVITANNAKWPITHIGKAVVTPRFSNKCNNPTYR